VNRVAKAPGNRYRRHDRQNEQQAPARQKAPRRVDAAGLCKLGLEEGGPRRSTRFFEVETRCRN